MWSLNITNIIQREEGFIQTPSDSGKSVKDVNVKFSWALSSKIMYILGDCIW